jgi:hypothetical protein
VCDVCCSKLWYSMDVRGATLTARKTPLRLLLRNLRVYRGAAYELPEQIRCNIYVYICILTNLKFVNLCTAPDADGVRSKREVYKFIRLNASCETNSCSGTQGISSN